MIKWIKDRRQRRESARLEKINRDKEAEQKLEQDLIERGKELKEALVEAGMIPLKRINRNLSDKSVFMYCLLDGRLVRAEMGIKGYLLLSYVGTEEKP